MGISKEDLLELAEAMKEIDEYRLVAGTIIDKALECGPELRRVLSAFVIGMTDLKIEAIRHYEDNGFTREQAMLLTMDSWKFFFEGLKSANVSHRKVEKS